MNTQELKDKYCELYDYMAHSGEPKNMKTFGNVMTEMFMWAAEAKPETASEWLEKLESVRWKQYLTKKEAGRIVSEMQPKAPWSREQWLSAMEQHGFPLEDEPCYNPNALFVTMEMIMSDSSETLVKYVGNENLFKAVHDLAVDKLRDADGKFCIRSYFNV